jgi:methylenetetrahydrofolate reductase (NADPH)
MGGRSIAYLKARDRNILGFQRYLLTAAAYGVDEFLFVYGDRPETGSRSDDLTVRSMLAEARRFSDRGDVGSPFRLGVASGLAPLPGWKQEADFVLAQVSFSAADLVAWRQTLEFDGPVFAGVIVLPSAGMARKLSTDVPQLAVPDRIIGLLEEDGSAGVDIACDLVHEIRQSQVFDGVHLIPVTKYREMAARLESQR